LPEIVQEIGAYAGLASVVGLAILSALYFSQARDVKRLREWAGRAPERIPGQPGQVTPQRVVAQPQQPGQQRPGVPAMPGQVRPGVPAVPGQTRPGVPTVPGQARPGVPTVPGQQRPGTPAVPAAAAAAGATPATATQGAPGNNVKSGVPAQTPAAGAQPGAPSVPGGAATQATQVVPAVGRPGTSAAQRPGATTGAQGGKAPPAGTARPSTAVTPPASEPWYRTPRYLVLALVGVLVVGGGAAFGATKLVGDDSSNAPKTSQANGDGDTPARKQAPVKPSSVTVAVLNGTLLPGLGRQVADQIEQKGFRIGNVDNSPDSSQQRAESVVQFAQGHRREATAVSRKLGIGQREPITAEVQALAGDATVVVITGQDQSQTP
jgi:hypothetical protein